MGLTKAFATQGDWVVWAELGIPLLRSPKTVWKEILVFSTNGASKKYIAGEGKNRAENAPNRKPRISLEKLRIYADKTVTEKDIKQPFHYEGASQEIIGLW